MRQLNIGLLAHVDAGKTTTVEHILFLSGKLKSPGSVDKGSTQTDFLAVERERGISITSASVTLEIDGVKLNIIDTPGHTDFTGEVERTLAVLDGAVLLVSAAEGIQSQTERFWEVLRKLHIPTIVFINKTDRIGCNPEAVFKTLQTAFGTGFIPVNYCQNPGETNVAVIENVMDEDSILELCEIDEGMAERFMKGETMSPDVLKYALASQTAKCKAFPLVYGAAAHGVGIQTLTNAIITYLPAAELVPKGELSGIVYKIEHTKSQGKTAHVRLYEGTLRIRDTIEIHRPGVGTFQDKITMIQKVFGSRREDIKQIFGNEVAVVGGMSNAKVGDMIGKAFEKNRVRISEPLFLVRIYGDDGKERELIQAVSELSDEDPLMDCLWDKDLRELTIRIMGKIQLEILEYLMMERYGLTVSFSAPSVIYKETPAQRGIGLERYTMPKPCWAVVKLQVDPLARGSGFSYESIIGESVLKHRYQNHVKTSVAEALNQGRLGWEVTDLKVTLIDGEDHKFHTHPMDFFLATPIAVMKALENAGSALLEPMVKLRLSADEAFTGKLIGDILGMRGEFDSPVISGGKVEIEAIVPAAASMDYPIKFSSLTSGRGTISSSFCNYKNCPPELGATAKRRGIDPFDRDKWILFKRGALG